MNLYRNIQGRYDLMRFLYKWDTGYRKDIMVTLLALATLTYSIMTWDSVYDFIAIAIELAIVIMQMGGAEMSILPVDYRPSHEGAQYTAQTSTHIAYDELSFSMSEVLPAPAEAALGFHNPFVGRNLCRESPLVSDKVDDALMTRDVIPYREEKSEINFISSRHQLRYIAIRVANKKQHTTNGSLLGFCDLADVLVNGDVTIRKAHYFDALLTIEAFRSRIFRGNLHGETEVYTDLTTYFPVRMEAEESQLKVRFLPDFHRRVSTHTGITSVLLTENRQVAMLYQGNSKAVGAQSVCLGGSGSTDYCDLKSSAAPRDYRDVITYALAREVCEETGMEKWFPQVRENTMVTGFFRWIDRCGLPEFVGITKAGDVPFSKHKAIDGDEVVRFDEVPVTINKPEDFIAVMEYLRNNQVRVALSSLMALRRLTVIAGYNTPGASETQKAIYNRLAAFLA